MTQRKYARICHGFSKFKLIIKILKSYCGEVVARGGYHMYITSHVFLYSIFLDWPFESNCSSVKERAFLWGVCDILLFWYGLLFPIFTSLFFPVFGHDRNQFVVFLWKKDVPFFPLRLKIRKRNEFASILLRYLTEITKLDFCWYGILWLVGTFFFCGGYSEDECNNAPE